MEATPRAMVLFIRRPFLDPYRPGSRPVRHPPPAVLDAGPGDVLGAGALFLGTTENLGYMSGPLKDFFDLIYYEHRHHTDQIPPV